MFDLSGRNHQLFDKYGGQKPGFDPRTRPTNLKNIYHQRDPSNFKCDPTDFKSNPKDFKCNPQKIKRL